MKLEVGKNKRSLYFSKEIEKSHWERILNFFSYLQTSCLWNLISFKSNIILRSLKLENIY